MNTIIGSRQFYARFHRGVYDSRRQVGRTIAARGEGGETTLDSSHEGVMASFTDWHNSSRLYIGMYVEPIYLCLGLTAGATLVAGPTYSSKVETFRPSVVYYLLL